MKLVADTNVLMSGSVWSGTASRCVDALLEGRAVLCLSPKLLAELAEVLACAVAAPADAIVTGDNDLLVLETFQGIPIIRVEEALRRLGLPVE